VCREHNIVEQTYYRWRNKYGGLEVSDAHKLNELESENAKLKRMAAEKLLVINGKGIRLKKMSTQTGRREARAVI